MSLLPDGVSAQDFDAALADFTRVVGPDWVFRSDDDVALYRDAFSPAWDEDQERRPSAAVAPANVEEVQAVMRIANQWRIPVYPISTGKNLGYGGSAPNLTGSVVVDLKRMNRIIEVNDKRHFAIVEPGVSYFDLHAHIQEKGLKVWIDVPGPGWGSPVGNSLDHGVGDTWGIYRNHFSAHCGMEVVLADGTLIRTGMGALPGAESWAEYPLGFGPTVDGLFAQGNFGIVTKMGFWLMPAPEAWCSGSISVPRRADIGPLIDFVNMIEHQGHCGEPAYSSPLASEQGHADYQALIAGGQFPSDEALEAFAADRGKPFWKVRLNFYGPTEVVQAQWAACKRLAAAQLPGATFEDGPLSSLPLPEKLLEEHDPVHFGIPTLGTFALTARSARNPEGADGHLFFSPIIPKSGEALLRFQRVMWQAFHDMGEPTRITPFTGPNTWMFHSFAVIVVFLISRTDKDANARVRRTFNTLIEVAARHGWGEYRTGPLFQDAVRSTYSFNDHSLLRFQERLKDAADPNGIVAAGRYGIWPKHLRMGR